MFLIIILLIACFFLFILNVLDGEVPGSIITGFLTLVFIFSMSFGDYYVTKVSERDIQIKYENLTQAGNVINGFSSESLIKNDRDISLENNNQASTFIQNKMKWVEKVVKHNENIMSIKWRYEQNTILMYISLGLTPFDSAEDLDKYLIELK
jgi:hypothetical protein